MAYDRSERVARFGISATLLGVMFTAGMVTRTWKQQDISCGRPFTRFGQEYGATAAAEQLRAEAIAATGTVPANGAPVIIDENERQDRVETWQDDCERTGRYAIALVMGGAAISAVGVGSLAASGYMDQSSRRASR